jgi:anti-anti-sigma factor
VTPFDVTRRETGDPLHIVLELSGELDLTNAREVEERLEAIALSEDTRLSLDLNRVVFIDSAALHVLFRTASRLGKERFSLLIDPGAAIARTISIVGMPEVATVVHSGV